MLEKGLKWMFRVLIWLPCVCMETGVPKVYLGGHILIFPSACGRFPLVKQEQCLTRCWAHGQAQQTTTGRARGTLPADMNTCNFCEGFLCCCPITSILEKQSASKGHGDTVTNLPGNPQLLSLPFLIHPASPKLVLPSTNPAFHSLRKSHRLKMPVPD